MVVPLTENATLDIRNTLHNNGIEQPIAPTEAPCLIVVGIQRYLQDSHFFSHVGLLEEFSTETTTPAVATPPTKLVTTGTSSRNNEETTSPTGGHAAAATPWWTVSPSSTTNNSTSSMIQQQIADCKTPAYDLLLSDGTYLLKCVLSPLLNGLVQYGWITLFTRIKLEKYEWRRNEWRIPVATILVVFQLSVQQVGGPMWMIDRSKLVFPDSADPCELKNSQPLAGRRLHYLSLNSEDSVPVDTQVSRKDILIDSLELFGSRSPQPLSKVLALYDNQKVVVVPLIGRVVKKFSCTHFGRRDSEQKFPIKFEFQLSDQHRLVHVVCWYTLYFRYFECIQLDDVVVLEGYRIRHQKEDHVEILLNPSNPQGKMYILDLKLVTSRNIRQWYPPCSLNLTDSSTLKNHPSSDVLYCDLVGRIHRLFPIHRYRPSHEYRFYERRWVLVRDSSSLFDIPILMYSCSQSKCFHVLQVGRPLLVTDCQLCRVGNNWEQNSFYLKTTFSSQLIYFEEQWEIVRKNHPEISFPQRFGEDEKEASELQYKECLSTYTRIRNYPDWLDSSRIDSWMEHLVTLEELQNRAKWLHLGECKTFLCQGKVKKVGWRYKKGYLPSQQVWEYPSYLPKYPQQQEEELAMDERFPVMKKKTTEYLEYLLDIISCDQKHRLTVVCTKSEVCRPYLDKKTMLRKASSHSRVLLEALDDVLLSRVLHGFASSAWETAAQVAENVAKCVKSETIIFEIEAMRWHPCTSIPPLSLAGVVFTLIGAYGGPSSSSSWT
jgi:hypothetical protein